MQEARIELLQRMAIFGGIREDIMKFLLDLCSIATVGEGEFFFRENDEANSMFVLEVGTVAVLKEWNGEQHLVRNLEKGDCFGEMALMDFGRRSASILAVEACQAIEVSAGSLFKIYEKDLEQFTLIEMNMGRELSRRLREADERLFRAKIGVPTGVANYVIRSA